MAARPTSAAASHSDYAVSSSMSVSMSPSTSVSRKYIYDRQFLLDIRNNDFVCDKHWLGVLCELGIHRAGPRKPAASPIATPASKHRKRCERTRKRGKRGGVYARLSTNPHKPAVPTIMLANVRSLDSKMDYIRLWRASQRSVRDCCVSIFTETWLNQNIADAAIQLDGLTLHRADRTASSGKLKGGGLAVYTNNAWCQDVKVVSTHCSPQIELMSVKCRPFYLPREMSAVVIVAVYVPPSANVKEAMSELYNNISLQQSWG